MERITKDSVMQKVLLFILLTLPALKTYAESCKVYGITDSPQHLSCRFPNMTLELNCRQGRYYLNQAPVSVAFHMDVADDGPSPLVFKTSQMQLTVLMADVIQAELEMVKSQVSGTCK
jgi:hypothetical protein